MTRFLYLYGTREEGDLVVSIHQVADADRYRMASKTASKMASQIACLFPLHSMIRETYLLTRTVAFGARPTFRGRPSYEIISHREAYGPFQAFPTWNPYY